MVQKRYTFELKRDLQIGDKYILIEYISEGTYGYVWKAIRCADEKYVALKIPKNQEQGDKVLAEGSKLKGVYHPNLIQIYDMGRVDGYFVIELELFEGHPLSRELIDSGISTPRTFQTVYDIFEQILYGLECMHDLNTAHGDIKPDNILIKGSQVKLTDFGTSRMIEDIFVKTIDQAGTYAYIAPEVIHSQKRYLNSDIYSVGVLLYQFLTGKTPHDTFIQVVSNKPFARPRELNKSIPGEMEKVILKALEREPEKRFQTVAELRSAFKSAAKSQFEEDETKRFVPRASLVEKRGALELAITNCKLGKYKLAEKILMTEITNGYKIPDVLLQLAYIYYKTDRRFEALKTIDQINLTNIEENRRDNILQSRDALQARILFSLKKYEQALLLYKKLTKLNPDNVDYRYRLSICYGLCNEENKAIEILEAINKETPGIWIVVKKLGQAYDQKKEYEKARGYFKYAQRLRPNEEYSKKKLELYDFYL